MRSKEIRDNLLYVFQKQTGPPQATEEFTMGCGEDRLGFIMFECGLEGIKLKVVKRSQFEKNENGENNKKNETEIFCTDSIKSQEELDNNIAGKKSYEISNIILI